MSKKTPPPVPQGKSRRVVPPALAVEEWAVGRLRPYDSNPRVITDVAVDKVAASISAFGFRQPIVVDQQGTVIVGHTRLRAAIKLGLPTVPVHVVSGWSEEKKRAYRLADNRVGEESSWDMALLSLELGSLGEFDLSLMGFAPDAAQLGEVEPPGEFPVRDETLATDHLCPKCGYQWSGGKTVEPLG